MAKDEEQRAVSDAMHLIALRIKEFDPLMFDPIQAKLERDSDDSVREILVGMAEDVLTGQKGEHKWIMIRTAYWLEFMIRARRIFVCAAL